MLPLCTPKIPQTQQHLGYHRSSPILFAQGEPPFAPSSPKALPVL